MITTGTPVSIALFEWLTWYANQHLTWFDKQHDHYQLINDLFTSNLTELESKHHDFIKFIIMMMLQFDGGFYSANLQSVFAKDDLVSIQWTNSIQHDVGYLGWDRSTRRALNYICKRTIGYSDFVDNMGPAFPLINAFLKTHYHELNRQLTDVSDLNRLLTETGSISENLFILLSAFPLPLLESFYLGIAELFPDEFVFDADHQTLSTKAFFSRPVNDSDLILDKVKMHYNLHFHSLESLPFIHDLEKQTLTFVNQSLNDSESRNLVETELSLVIQNQLSPRVSLLALVLDHFQWPS